MARPRIGRRKPRPPGRFCLNHRRVVCVRLALAMLRGIRIVVVDDDTDSREVTAMMLRVSGADVRVAASAEAALRAVADFAPRVLVSDLAMPDVDGYMLMSQLRANEASGTRLLSVAVSGHAYVEDRDRALEAGFDAHLSKPVDASHLVDVVRGLLVRGELG
jgi:CheY-like chemotaxis protein